MSIFAREENGLVRVSLRSKPGTSSNDMAGRFFHGGGHERAAGGKLYFPQDIPSPAAAADYIEITTARFMRNPAPSETE